MGFYLSRTDVAEHCHVATRERTDVWHVDTCVHVCVTCVRDTHVCAWHVCADFIYIL